MKKCCIYCLKDSDLEIYTEEKGQPGKCSFCKQQNVCISLEDDIFVGIFLFIKEMYMEAKSLDCETISYFIIEEWRIFEGNYSYGILKELCKIHDCDYSKLYQLNEKYNSYKQLWDEFKQSLLRGNRFTNSLPKEIEAVFNIYEKEKSFPLSIKQELFRARLGSFEDKGIIPFPSGEMGMPPESKVSEGRSNPTGIRYLYMSTDEETAIAEVRAWTGALVTIAEINPNRYHILLNLTRFSKKSIIKMMKSDIDKALCSNYFFDALIKEMSYPVSIRDNSLNYLPTQFITEYIKNLGFDGIAFDSSLSSGQNIVLFEQDGIDIKSTELYKVDFIRYGFSKE